MEITYKHLRFSLQDIYQTDHLNDEYFFGVLEFLKHWTEGKSEFEMYTSGSTGIPKKITITRDQMKYSAEMTLQALQLNNKDHSLVCLNTNYIAGRMMLVRSLIGQMDTTIVPPSVDPISDVMGKCQITFTAMVPYQIQHLLERNDRSMISFLNNMKCLIIGGAPIHENLAFMIQKLEVPVYSTYGMTETVSHIALRKLNGTTPDTSFKVLSGVQIATDERGCLKIKSKITSDRFIQTNDVVELKNEGEFLWKGRIDNTINSGGVKVLAEELESILAKTFSKLNIDQEFVIIGLPHSSLGEEVRLIIEGIEVGTKEKHLLDDLRIAFTKFHLPRKITYLPKFPRKNNKIDRISIRKILLNHSSITPGDIYFKNQ